MKIFHTLFVCSFLMISGCTAVGLSALNATSRLESGHDVTKNISYGDQQWQTLDVHTPKQNEPTDNTPTENAESPKPVVVFFYGGAWTSGNKGQYYFAASAFTDIGYVVVVPDYIKYPDGRFPTFVHDGVKALAWTKANIASHGGDPEKLFVVGHSAGAHLGALMLADENYLDQIGLKSDDITAFAGMAGPYNFTPKEKPYTEIFGPEENFPKMKVMNYIDGSEPPMLLLHGTDDETVGILNKDSLIEKISEQGGEAGDISYDGLSHVGILLSLHPTFVGSANAADDIDKFFKAQNTVD